MGNLRLKNITKKYGDQLAVNDVSFEIEKGSLFTFLGPSGCGKTTILRMIAGLIKEDRGEIFLNQVDLGEIPTEKREIGMVFQNYALFPHLNVYDNIAYGLKIKGAPKAQIKESVQLYLDLVNLQQYGNRKIAELSGGEQQRVALARALITEPKLFLLDEPLSNLDAKLRMKMRLEIRELQKKLGITTIFVTHDQEEAMAISDQIAVFNEGKCIQIGSPQEIYENPINGFVANFMGETNLLERGQWNIKTKEGRGEKLSIRPEKIILSKVQTQEINEYQGIILQREFCGKTLEYILQVEQQKLKATVINRAENIFQVGQSIMITIPIDDIRIVN